MVTFRQTNDPFEFLFRNFFDAESNFSTIQNCKFGYPVDIYEDEKGLRIDIAAISINQDEIEIKVEDGRVLRVLYDRGETKTEQQDLRNLIHKGIAKRSFNLGWKIGTSYNLEEIDATLDKGLLSIAIPYSEKSATKQISIKVKE